MSKDYFFPDQLNKRVVVHESQTNRVYNSASVLPKAGLLSYRHPSPMLNPMYYMAHGWVNPAFYGNTDYYYNPYQSEFNNNDLQSSQYMKLFQVPRNFSIFRDRVLYQSRLCCEVCGCIDPIDRNELVICDGCGCIIHQQCYHITQYPPSLNILRILFVDVICHISKNLLFIDGKCCNNMNGWLCCVCFTDSNNFKNRVSRDKIYSILNDYVNSESCDRQMLDLFVSYFAPKFPPNEATNQKTPEITKHECVLCPTKGGVMKQIPDGRWAHVSCVVYLREDSQFLFDFNSLHVHKINNSSLCYLCNVNQGLTRKCMFPDCNNWIHITCAFNAGCSIKREFLRDVLSESVLVVVCLLHNSKAERQRILMEQKRAVLCPPRGKVLSPKRKDTNRDWRPRRGRPPGSGKKRCPDFEPTRAELVEEKRKFRTIRVEPPWRFIYKLNLQNQYQNCFYRFPLRKSDLCNIPQLNILKIPNLNRKVKTYMKSIKQNSSSVKIMSRRRFKNILNFLVKDYVEYRDMFDICNDSALADNYIKTFIFKNIINHENNFIELKLAALLIDKKVLTYWEYNDGFLNLSSFLRLPACLEGKEWKFQIEPLQNKEEFQDPEAILEKWENNKFVEEGKEKEVAVFDEYNLSEADEVDLISDDDILLCSKKFRIKKEKTNDIKNFTQQNIHMVPTNTIINVTKIMHLNIQEEMLHLDVNELVYFDNCIGFKHPPAFIVLPNFIEGCFYTRAEINHMIERKKNLEVMLIIKQKMDETVYRYDLNIHDIAKENKMVLEKINKYILSLTNEIKLRILNKILMDLPTMSYQNKFSDNLLNVLRWQNRRYYIILGHVDIITEPINDESINCMTNHTYVQTNNLCGLDKLKALLAGDNNKFYEEFDLKEVNNSVSSIASCCICFRFDKNDSCPLYTCHRCNIIIHIYCYGETELTYDKRQANWYCDKCIVERSYKNKKFVLKSKLCCICYVGGGALKQCIDGNWIHVICGIWLMPYVYCKDFENLSSWVTHDLNASSKVCSLCGNSKGYCVDCSYPSCTFSFHPMCVWLHGLFVVASIDSLKFPRWGDTGDYQMTTRALNIAQYCLNHTPPTITRHAAEQSKSRCQRLINKDITLSPEGDDILSKFYGNKEQTDDLMKPDIFPSDKCAICYKGYEEEQEFFSDSAKCICATCTLTVHSGCYGVIEANIEYIEGNINFKCDVCKVGYNPSRTSCLLCSRRGGAFMLCEDEISFCHSLCLMFTPGVHLTDNNRISNLDLDAFEKHECSLCTKTRGYTTMCQQKGCKIYYHITCAIVNGCYLSQSYSDGDIQYETFCFKHTTKLSNIQRRLFFNKEEILNEVNILDSTIAYIKESQVNKS